MKPSDENQENIAEVDSIQEQLTILNQTSFYFHLLVVAYLLNFETLDIQRLKILCSAMPSEDCKDIPSSKPCQITASILIVISFSYFTKITKQNYLKSTATEKEKRKLQLSYFANLLSLIASIIRLSLILTENTSSIESIPS